MLRRFMNNVARTLESIKGSVPDHAEPIVLELAGLVCAARSKMSKYASRGMASSIWHIRSEKVRPRPSQNRFDVPDSTIPKQVLSTLQGQPQDNSVGLARLEPHAPLQLIAISIDYYFQ